MKQKILVGSEPTFSKLLHLECRLIGEGSYRLLSSSIRLSIQPDLIADFSSQMCEIIILVSLPSGVFADPFELQHLIYRGAFKDTYVFGDANLELPSFLSNQSIIEVHLDAALNYSAGQETVLEFNIEIPLHARYPVLVSSLEQKIDETEKKFEETSKISEERLKQTLDPESRMIKLKTNMQRLEEKIFDMESERN
ncbi:uncharacterized protein [Spinacia oleracea]|uniref:Uncharacterized protein isoform X2 n=1 Tax=Spinacia oleracea TaxID=3562 RepID=A0ABM3QPL4_SPIOL|nr:uncharacterized protein LOC130461285 isoform X2 [Spinacia oleracea]